MLNTDGPLHHGQNVTLQFSFKRMQPWCRDVSARFSTLLIKEGLATLCTGLAVGTFTAADQRTVCTLDYSRTITEAIFFLNPESPKRSRNSLVKPL